MEIKSFFDNLNCFFDDTDSNFADLPATVHKNEEGEIEEIRIYIPDYDQFMYINRTGIAKVLDVEEEKEKIEERKKAAKLAAKQAREAAKLAKENPVKESPTLRSRKSKK